MNTDLKIPFALNKIDNKMYEPKDAKKFSEEFICPCCLEPLTVNKGKIKVPYFSHKANSICHSEYAVQTSLHLKAKEILETNPNKYILVPKINGFWEDSKFVYKKIFVEKKIHDIIPDVILEDNNGNRLLIEITVTHGIDEIKMKKIEDVNLSVLEIDLSDINRNIDTIELRKLIIDNLQNKKWIYDKNLEENFKQLLKEDNYCHLTTSVDAVPINNVNCYSCKHSISHFNKNIKICGNKITIKQDSSYQDWINLSNNNKNIVKFDKFSGSDYIEYTLKNMDESISTINFKLPFLTVKSSNEQKIIEEYRTKIIDEFIIDLNKIENIKYQKDNINKIYDLLLYYSGNNTDFWVKRKADKLIVEPNYNGLSKEKYRTAYIEFKEYFNYIKYKTISDYKYENKILQSLDNLKSISNNLKDDSYYRKCLILLIENELNFIINNYGLYIKDTTISTLIDTYEKDFEEKYSKKYPTQFYNSIKIGLQNEIEKQFDSFKTFYNIDYLLYLINEYEKYYENEFPEKYFERFNKECMSDIKLEWKKNIDKVELLIEQCELSITYAILNFNYIKSEFNDLELKSKSIKNISYFSEEIKIIDLLKKRLTIVEKKIDKRK